MDIYNNYNNVLLLVFLIPGFVSLKIYDLLIAGDNRDFSKSILEVIAFSAVNLALLSWLIWPIMYYEIYDGYPKVFALMVFLILFIFPGMWPILYLKLINQLWLAKAIVHPIRRPWDWFFSKKRSFWVIVTLKDGRKIGGIYSNGSYASSFPLSEKIYLEQTWDLDEKNRFIGATKLSKGIIILGNNISTLEFFNN